MTAEEAKKLVLEKIQEEVNEEYPYAWVGNIDEERENLFFVEGTLYADGENPEEEFCIYIVDKRTGDVSLPGRIEFPEDIE